MLHGGITLIHYQLLEFKADLLGMVILSYRLSLSEVKIIIAVCEVRSKHLAFSYVELFIRTVQNKVEQLHITSHNAFLFLVLSLSIEGISMVVIHEERFYHILLHRTLQFFFLFIVLLIRDVLVILSKNYLILH